MKQVWDLIGLLAAPIACNPFFWTMVVGLALYYLIDKKCPANRVEALKDLVALGVTFVFAYVLGIMFCKVWGLGGW